MGSLSIKVDVLAGTSIADAAAEARDLANRIGVDVDFRFNGVHCVMQPGGSPAVLEDRWREELASDRPCKMAVAHGDRQ